MPKPPPTADTATPLDPARVRALRRALLAWYRKHHRTLPWRRAPGPGNAAAVDPYHTLVSEAMLQQTQVATVVPYFERFIQALPTLDALARADEQRVLRLWQGLGYYRRARNLHAAARMIVDDFDGEVPADVPALLKLPGVGRYSAGAIASIAHDTPAPIIDGNVARVFARLFHIKQPVDRPDVVKQLWSIAGQLVPKRSPGDFNQALMELGALVCTPKSPGCLTCPLRKQCKAADTGDPERLPMKLPKKKPKDVTHLVVAVGRGGKYLFEQRPATGLWSNMWQLPTWEDVDPDTARACDDGAQARIAGWFADRCGVTPGGLTAAHDFTHQTTHRTIRFVVLAAVAEAGRTRPGTGRWHKLDQLDDLPLSNPQRTAIASLTSPSS